MADIASDLVRQMGLTPAAISQLSEPVTQQSSSQFPQQQYNPQMQPQYNPQSQQQYNPQMQSQQQQYNPQLQQYPQQQQSQSQSQSQQPVYQPPGLQSLPSGPPEEQPEPTEITDEDTVSNGSITKYGIEENLVDRIISEIKTPLLVMIIFVIFSLPIVNRNLENLIKVPFIVRSNLYMLLTRAVLAGLTFYLLNYTVTKLI